MPLTLNPLHVLSAGAVKGLFAALGDHLSEQSLGFVGVFGAAGATLEKLLTGEPCDLLVLPLPMLEKLAVDGLVERDTIAVIGAVGAGIAVRSGTPWPDVSQASRLAANLASASALYFPDPQRATAGRHFAKMLEQLRLTRRVAQRCRHFPTGANAMAALAESRAPLEIGCTQVSEILYTPGVDLVGELPAPYALTTVYAAALTHNCARREQALLLLQALTGSAGEAARAAGGFR